LARVGARIPTARRLLERGSMDLRSSARVEVVSLRNGNSWAVMVGGRQAVVVTRREAALQIAEEIAAHVERVVGHTSAAETPRGD
jgi:hypothetical protein